MHLARLQISGFKSFSEKTVLEFRPGITAIVGPNGSGKSNVVDAIRWVLGEQGYRGIRLEKSEDVIFLGSKGASRLSRASVEMTLDNRDGALDMPYEEIVIARHVYRGGEGEYYLNRAQVRLKDVLETLARARISLKNFSIVTQGMSDQLLRFSPQELRSTLEEASGVKEWQLKKHDAERKLARSVEHMGQIQGLLAELKPYLRNLESQMKRWERRESYAKRLQELEELKLYLGAKRLAARRGEVEGRRKSTQERLQVLGEEKTRLAAQISAAEENLKISVRRDPAGDEAGKRLYGKRLELERELVRFESRLASRHTHKTPFEAEMVLVRIQGIREMLEGLAAAESFEALREGVQRSLALLSELEKFLRGEVGQDAGDSLREHQRLKSAIRDVEHQLDQLQCASLDQRAEEQRLKEELFGKERASRRAEDELERLLAEESAVVTELGALEREEQSFLERASRLMPDFPGTFPGALRALETSHGLKPSLDPEKLEEEIMRAKVYVAEAGELDPRVREEYQTVKQRHDFLAKELADVTAARADLEKLAVGLESEIGKRFEEAFRSVNKEFAAYMEAIFGGGRGELIKIVPRRARKARSDDALDEEEPEEEKEGVAVRVELPGKRIKSIELLSGGERALTSIAFLFAVIASAKPPFVILDEVDAALDEANSQRFADLLASAQQHTQFVVVTHNRSTMHAAQVLYGVTMGGDGISRILSLKLEA